MATSGGRSLAGVVGAANGISTATPAAGADFTQTISGNNALIAVTATLTTAVAVANRSAALKITDGTGKLVVRGIQSSVVQAASLAFDYTWMVGAGGIIAGATQITLPLPAEVIQGSGAVVASLTLNLQAADQWSNIVMYLSPI